MDNPGGAGYLTHECETAGLPTGSRANGDLRFYLCRSGAAILLYACGVKKESPAHRAVRARASVAGERFNGRVGVGNEKDVVAAV